MKKSIVNLLFVLCMAVTLMGCQKKDNNIDKSTELEESIATEAVDKQNENSETKNNQTTSAKSIFSDKLQDWQKNYCKILLGVLGETEETREMFGECWRQNLQDNTSVGDTFRLMDIDKDMIPELLVGNVLFFADGKRQLCVSGIKEETNQIILYEDCNTDEPMYVANIKNSKLDIEFVIWSEEEVAWKKAYNVEYGRYYGLGTSISEEEYDKLSDEYYSNLFLPKGVELTLSLLSVSPFCLIHLVCPLNL